MSSSPSILCAVDLSSHSRTVLQHAGAIAEHFGARLIAATVAPADRSIPAHDETALRAFVLDALPGASRFGRPHELRVGYGPAAATILEIAREEAVDLIVVGTHGVGGFRKHMFGSTTEGVLRHAEFPVLVVPKGASDLRSLDDERELRGIGTVLAPVDFGPLAQRDARIASAIAAALSVPLLLVHVAAATGVAGVLDRVRAVALDPDVARDQLLGLRAELGGEAAIETLVLQGHPADEIAALVERRNVGLVVMGLRGAGGALGKRPGSIAFRTLCLSPAMVLALPPVLRKPASDAIARERHTV
jgi:nucleotide-binding universal stress UspA family protein